jgi:hypothetical protein
MAAVSLDVNFEEKLTVPSNDVSMSFSIALLISPFPGLKALSETGRTAAL